MAITAVKIHPSIGIARLGNSPDAFFVGPERPHEPPAPSGGFKDAQCRVKRQAARFRIFAHHDDGSFDEITADEADITWTVHLRNRKAAVRNRNSGEAEAGVTIDPGPRTLDGPDQRKMFVGGTFDLSDAAAVDVPLGEARTDDGGHLLVLGGFGFSSSPTDAGISHFRDNDDWHDDVADGPVTATVHLHATDETFEAVASWIIVAPPKFAPELDNVITLWDVMRDLAISQGWLPAPDTPVSYTDDVWPVLRRAEQSRWVQDSAIGHHGWSHPVVAGPARDAIFGRLEPPGGGGGAQNMPVLSGSARLTATQYGVMEHWKNGDFTDDWSGPPSPGPLTPEGVDRAALEACVGAAFFPGIEAGDFVENPSRYLEPFRFDPDVVSAGDVTAEMACPWQADFKACGPVWWPVPRPNDVTPEAGGGPLAWDRDVGNMEEMVDEWHTLGFVVRQGDEYVEVDRCDTASITLLTPLLHFQDVPQGPMGMPRTTALAIAFDVISPGAAVTLEIASGDGPSHPRVGVAVGSDAVGPTASGEVARARLWITYQTGSASETITDQVTVSEAGGPRTWTVDVVADTVPRLTTAAALVLDRSGSMSEDRGDGQSKRDSLAEAASIFVDVMLEDDGVGVVRYNQDADPLQAVTPLGDPADPFDTGRADTKALFTGSELDPDGATSIGDGIFEGRQLLDDASGYDLESLVVLTDGKENRERWISDVAGEIDERTYSVGLGTPDNTSAPALQAVSGNHGGFLLITGEIDTDNRFLLQKYFLQILAGISNAEIVLDPEGSLVPGREQRIPFRLTEADAGMDVVLLTPHPTAVDFRLQTPNGLILPPWRARSEPDMRYVLSDGVAYYRVALPVELEPARFEQAGLWHALLQVGRPRLEPDRREEQPPTEDRLAPRLSHGEAVRFPSARAPAEVPVPRELSGIARARPQRLAALRTAAARVPGKKPARTLPYSLVVHAWSDLSFRARATQTGHEPGATLRVEATLAEAGVPRDEDVRVWGEVTRPDGGEATLATEPGEDGAFRGKLVLGLPGVYAVRIRATGRSRKGHPFTRERTLTGAVWHGGDRDAEASGGHGPGRRREDLERRFCELLRCLAPTLAEAAGLDPGRVKACIERSCARRSGEPGDDAAIRDLVAGLDRETLARLLGELRAGDA